MPEDITDKKKKSKPEKAKSKPKPPPPIAPSINAYRPVVSAEQEADFMSSLLGTVDSMATDPLPKASRKRKPSPKYEESRYKRDSYRRRSPFADASSDGHIEDLNHASSDDAFSSPHKRTRIEDGAITPAAERLATLEVDDSSDGFDSAYHDINMDDFMGMEDDFDINPPIKREEPVISLSKKPASKATTSNLKEEADVKPAWLSVYDSLAVEYEDTLGPLSTSNSSSSTNPTNISALEEDGSLRFFWIDYMELDGKLYFIGKLKEKSSGTWISCCVKVEGIERNLFVLPREKRVEQDEDGNIHETDIIPSQEDIDDDFDLIRKAMKIKSYRAKFVKRKYAFGEQDIPRGESQWMKVIYGYNGAYHFFYMRSDVHVPSRACDTHECRKSEHRPHNGDEYQRL